MFSLTILHIINFFFMVLQNFVYSKYSLVFFSAVKAIVRKPLAQPILVLFIPLLLSSLG